MYDQAWQEERKRLAGMEDLWDPGTQAAIESVGIAPGWRCLEVGAGGGSIADWLAERVGPEGYVLATDVTTRYLDALDAPDLEVREHDILNDPLPEGRFRPRARPSRGRAPGPPGLGAPWRRLRPGGWLVLEDYACDAAGVEPGERRCSSA